MFLIRKKHAEDELLLHDGILMSVKNNLRFPELLIHSLITVLGGCSAMFCFQGFYGFPFEPKYLILLLSGFSLFMLLLRKLSPKAAFIGVLLSFTAIPLLLLRYRDEAVIGVQTFYDVMSKIVMHEPVHYVNSSLAGTRSGYECMRFLFDLTALAVGALLEYSDVLISSRRSGRSGFFTRFLVTFPFLECGLYFGLETDPRAVVLLIAFWVASLALVRTHVPRREAKANRKKMKQQTQTFTSNEVSAAILLAAVSVLGFAVLAFTGSYARSQEMDIKRRQILDKWNSMSVNDVTGLLQKIPSKLGIRISGDEIELDEIDRLHFEGRPAFYAVVGASELPEDLYLRGLVRAEYTGHGWALPTDAYAGNRGLFRELTALGRMPQTYLYAEDAEALRKPDGSYPVVGFDMFACNDESVNYLPYQALCGDDAKYRDDWEIELRDTQKYNFWLLNTVKVDWARISQLGGLSDDATLRKYELFAEDTYLSVPETDAMRAVRDDFLRWCNGDRYFYMAEGSTLLPRVPLEEKLATIRNYLWDSCEYDTAPGKTPDGKDYTEYFLMENHRGFCAHYATAATLLCRMCGIPARYCQGYVMTDGNLSEAAGADSYLFTIPDEQAHAWTEIFIPRYGWVPFEFTEDVADTWDRTPGNAESTATTTMPAITSISRVTTPSSRMTVPTSSSSTVATGSGSTPGEAPPQKGTPWYQYLLRILGILLAIACPVCLWRLYHFAVVRGRKRALGRQNPSLAADAAYQFLIKLLSVQGVQQGNIPHEEFALVAEEHCTLLHEGDMQKAVEIEQAVVFSNHTIPPEDADRLCSLATSLADRLYQTSGRLRRFVLRWFYHIVA